MKIDKNIIVVKKVFKYYDNAVLLAEAWLVNNLRGKEKLTFMQVFSLLLLLLLAVLKILIKMLTKPTKKEEKKTW